MLRVLGWIREIREDITPFVAVACPGGLMAQEKLENRKKRQKVSVEKTAEAEPPKEPAKGKENKEPKAPKSKQPKEGDAENKDKEPKKEDKGKDSK